MTTDGFKSICALVATLITGASTLSSAYAASDQGPTIPTCDKKIGTLAVVEPENKWWTNLNLESPEALIKEFVAQSKCFTLLDRNKGLAAAQSERALASSGEVRSTEQVSLAHWHAKKTDLGWGAGGGAFFGAFAAAGASSHANTEIGQVALG